MAVCSNLDVLKVIYFILLIIDIVKIIIPIALIVFGLIDFSKAVITNDEKVQKKSGQLFFKRILYAVLVFAVPWIIEVFMVTLGNLLGEEGTTNFTDCLENANSECIDALDSKNLENIKAICDVSEDFEIEEDIDDSNDDSSLGQQEVCWRCADNNNLYHWGINEGTDSNCHSVWYKSTVSKEKCIQNVNNNSTITSDKNITFSYQWVTNDAIDYALYTPSSAKNNKKTPLIVWLHGAGEINDDESTFKNSGLLTVLNNWSLEGFNAYVLCPRSSGIWIDQKNQVYTVIDNIIREKNIDTDKIILVGHSLGGTGVQTIADGKTSYYSALVILSGYNSGVDLNQFKNIPIRGYVGGELDTEDRDKNSLYFMDGILKKTFGSDNLFILDNVGHSEVPKVAFNLDSNNDNKSDLIEWMLSQ